MPISITARSYGGWVASGSRTISVQYTVSVSSTLAFSIQEVIQYPRQRTALGVAAAIGPVLNPNTQISQFFESRWHQPWSEPVRINFRKGIPARFQQFYTAPVRYLPPANVTVTMAADDPPVTDEADFGVTVGDIVQTIDQTALYVSIEEIPAQSGGNASIKGTD